MFDLKELKKISKIFVLSGAGLDAESNIKTFRASEGLWEGHDVYSVAHPDGWAKDRDLVNSFYNERRRHLLSLSVKPNDAHYALAELDSYYEINIITQNISDLQNRAGSKSVIQMHGSLLEIFCENDRSHIFRWEKDLTTKDLCVKCGGSQRVNVVWFSEPVLHLEKIQKFAASSDLFISTGTSNQVFPANSLVTMFRQMNKPTVELNLERTVNSDLFDYGIYDKPATLSVVEFKNMLIQDK
ncbi:NAD-dependent protein deacylase [Alphaproteobacteria bacterium]|nr:NAD-dependent protein deacylase [Alphaproteobacteria bacterium]